METNLHLVNRCPSTGRFLPTCSACNGTGIINVEYNNNPYSSRDVACDEPNCAAGAFRAEDAGNPHDTAWSSSVD